MLQLNLDLTEVNRMFSQLLDENRFQYAIRRAQNKVMLEIRRDVIPHVPRDTGELINSWRIERSGLLTLEAGFDIVYAMYQHQGRRADGTHIIINRPAGGKTFFLKETLEANYLKYMGIYIREFERIYLG